MPLGPRRHIELVSSVAIDPSTPAGAVSINRVVEIRACHGGADGNGSPYIIDWGNTQARAAGTPGRAGCKAKGCFSSERPGRAHRRGV